MKRIWELLKFDKKEMEEYLNNFRERPDSGDIYKQNKLKFLLYFIMSRCTLSKN